MFKQIHEKRTFRIVSSPLSKSKRSNTSGPIPFPLLKSVTKGIFLLVHELFTCVNKLTLNTVRKERIDLLQFVVTLIRYSIHSSTKQKSSAF